MIIARGCQGPPVGHGMVMKARQSVSRPLSWCHLPTAAGRGTVVYASGHLGALLLQGPAWRCVGRVGVGGTEHVPWPPPSRRVRWRRALEHLGLGLLLGVFARVRRQLEVAVALVCVLALCTAGLGSDSRLCRSAVEAIATLPHIPEGVHLPQDGDSRESTTAPGRRSGPRGRTRRPRWRRR